MESSVVCARKSGCTHPPHASQVRRSAPRRQPHSTVYYRRFLLLIAHCMRWSGCVPVSFGASLLWACGGGSHGHAIAPTPTSASTQTYAITGTVNGQAATGTLILGNRMLDLNVFKFDVISFELGNLKGAGNGQWLSVSDFLSMDITASETGHENVHLNGNQRDREFPTAISDYNLTGPGYAIVFSTE